MKKQLLIIYFSIFAIILSACTADKDTFSQLSEGSGENYARIKVEHYGNIDIRLFTSKEPLLVDRFLTDIDKGIYNGTALNTCIDDYYLMFGTGTAEKIASSYTPSAELHPYYGAVAVNISDGNLPDPSSFIMITVADKELGNITDLLGYKGYDLRQYLEAGYGVTITEDELNAYYENGGAPWLEGHCAVFGQIYDGYDVLSTIASDLRAGKEPQDIRIIEIEYK